MFPQKTFFTKKYDVTDDFFNGDVVSLPKILSCLEEVAKLHAVELGFGFDDMLKRNLLWMISKTKIVLENSFSNQVESIQVITWPVKNRKFFCDRYFVIKDQNDNVVCFAVQIWLMIDKDLRKIAPTSLVEQIYSVDFDQATILDTKFDKILFDQEFCQVATHVVDKSLLDDNNHVNNVHYVQFVLAEEKEQVCNLEITYQHELFLKDVLHIYKKQQGNVVLVCGIKQDGVTSFCAKYQLSPSYKGENV